MWFGYLLCLLVVCCEFWLFGYGGGFCLVFWGCLLCLCSGLLVCLLFIVNSVGYCVVHLCVFDVCILFCWLWLLCLCLWFRWVVVIVWSFLVSSCYIVGYLFAAWVMLCCMFVFVYSL